MMGIIKINGITIDVDRGNITVQDGKIYVDGNVVEGDFRDINIEGNVNILNTSGSVTVHGNVKDLDAGGSVTCHDVTGDVDAGGSVTCNKIGGDIDAGGSVRIKK